MREGVAAARGFAVGVGMRLDLSNYLPKFTIDVPIRSPNRWPRRTTLAWIAGVGLAGLVAIVALLPLLMSARYRVVGEAALASDAASATVAFQQALRWSPNNPEIHRALAQSYLRLNQPQEAIDMLDMLEQAYRLRPESLLIRQELAQAYEASGQIERADGLWRSLGLSAATMLMLGEQARAAKDFDSALVWYARATRIGSDLGSSIEYNRALVLRDQGQLQPAFEALGRATAEDRGWLSPQMRFQAWRLRGTWLYEQRQMAAAEAALVKSIALAPAEKQLHPDLSEAYRFLALAQWNQQHQQEALQSLEMALTLNPQNPWAYIDRGKLVYLQDRANITTAEMQFTQALAFLPENVDVWKQIIGFWQYVGETQKIALWCQEAQSKGIASQLDMLCPNR
jgi:tetratricopeptide (TPR) repeat protein